MVRESMGGCPRRPPAKSACLEGPILEAHIGTLHSPAVSHLLSDTTFPQLGILRVPLFVPVLAGFLLRTTQVRSAPGSNWQPPLHLTGRRYHVRGLSFATCSPSANNVRPWHCSQRARTAVLRLPLRWTFVKHACGKLWTLVSTSETQTRINN